MDNDPLYRQGLQHFGQGEWPEAVACFEQLQATYPDDLRARQFLETARLRAAMGSDRQRGLRAETRRTWLRRFGWIGIAAVFLAIAGAVYFAYQAWAIPAQAESARQARIAQLRQTALVQVASGLYGDAAKTYQGILAEVPGDSEATAGLARVQQLEEVATMYAQAMQALDAGNQQEAARLLEQIRAIDPDYRDASGLLTQIQTTQQLTEAFQQAASLYQSNDWIGAAQAFESIRSTDPNFKPTEVKDYLFKAFMGLGNQQVEQADTIGAIQVADGYFQKALSVRPLDAQADAARLTAQTFLDGATAYQVKDWETTIRELSTVYEQQPGYFKGRVAQWLFEAFLTTGDDFMGQGDPFSARDRYAEAVRLAPSEAQRADAEKRFTKANKLTTPTPTPRPSPTPLPAGYVAPSWTRRSTGTPDPSPFVLINMTYVPNTITGDGCKWAGVAGRIYDMKGAPLKKETLGVRVTGPVDQGAAAGSSQIIGESGWIVQFDVRAKNIPGFVQVYYKDQPASVLIPFTTRNSCYENMLIIDIQQVRPLP